MLFHGGLYPVHLLMESFGRFLSRMGYPEARIRDPGDQAWSYSPYEDAEKLAGIVAWEYETSGLHPMLIGHSQGGMQAVKVLHELAGHFDKAVRVYDPVRGAFLDRTSIVDPLTHRERPVVGLSVSYASAVGAGGATFLMPNQWSMLDKLESIPNTVAEFTGFTVGIDLIGVPCVGDGLRDLQCAAAVDAQPILVLTGKGERTLREGGFPPNTLIYPDLAFAVSALLEGE